jgi:hypothetical protein
LAEQSLDPEHAPHHIGLLCWEISRSTIAARPVLGEATENGDYKERQSKRSH